MQAMGIKLAVESHRRHKPFSMGTLVWQLNDVWPVTSWASVDSYGVWKAQQYMTRRLYKPIILSVAASPTKDYEVYVVSDKLEDITGNLIVAIESFNGTIHYFDAVNNYYVPEGSSSVAYVINNATLANYDLQSTFIWAYFSYAGDSGFAQTEHYFKRPLDLELEKPNITVSLNGVKNTVTLHTDKLARDVYLFIDKVDIKFTDNFFDMLPGVLYTVDVLNNYNVTDYNDTLKVFSLWDTYNTAHVDDAAKPDDKANP